MQISIVKNFLMLYKASTIQRWKETFLMLLESIVRYKAIDILKHQQIF